MSRETRTHEVEVPIKPLKVGVVGLSGIGRLHVECCRNDELAELVAVCDLVREKADQIASEFGVRAYQSVDEMLEFEPDLDMVSVATGGVENGSWHYRPVMQALAAGKHVLVEKPLSNDIQEARDMVEEADRRGLYLGCNLNHYFTPVAQEAKERIDRGELGEIRYALMKMSFPGGEELYAGPPPNPNMRGYPYAHVKAFLTHPLSVMRFLCGDITHVQAFFDRPGFRRTAGDVMLSHTSIHVRFANDATGYLLSHRGDTPLGLGGWWHIEVGGTKGTLAIENCVEKLVRWPVEKLKLGEASNPSVTETGVTDFNQTFPWRIRAFFEDVAAGVPIGKLRGSGRDALAALEYTWAAMESHEQGGALIRPHPLPPAR